MQLLLMTNPPESPERPRQTLRTAGGHESVRGEGDKIRCAVNLHLAVIQCRLSTSSANTHTKKNHYMAPSTPVFLADSGRCVEK